ncbi:hypothetical protein QR685DRAFT_535652 [Neurospora intermedia]|uniref:Uncharacterized protein n=1 Tax=Neurospora intermedia TaxID=5142 RepID=A0ABR3D1W2_NEUIN
MTSPCNESRRNEKSCVAWKIAFLFYVFSDIVGLEVDFRPLLKSTHTTTRNTASHPNHRRPKKSLLAFFFALIPRTLILGSPCFQRSQEKDKSTQYSPFGRCLVVCFVIVKSSFIVVTRGKKRV